MSGEDFGGPGPHPEASTTVVVAPGIEAVLTVSRALDTVRINALVVPSAETLALDEEHRTAWAAYDESAQRLGLRDAGAPPVSPGVWLFEHTDITPPPAYRTPGRSRHRAGGTGTEWLAVWSWDVAGIPSAPGNFAITTPCGDFALCLSED